MPITLVSDTQSLEATILPQGATLWSLRFEPSGRSLVVSFADPADHFRYPACAGAIVGPVANRIAGGQITLGDTTYQMPCNENSSTSLHSGPEGLHLRDWRVAAQSDSQVTLQITLADGEYGLPGQREIAATYKIKGSDLILELSARTDQPTPINLAHHPYWTLDDAENVSGHQLQINADHYLPVDPMNLPMAPPQPTSGSAFDFSCLRPVPLTPLLDVNFCLADAPETALRTAATLIGADGTLLRIDTTAPGLQVYAGAYLPNAGDVLDGNAPLAPYRGIALEPQFWPDAPRNSAFPQITLNPGDVWRQTTCYRLKKTG